MPPANPNDVANLLPAENLELLRNNYDREDMIKLLENVLPAQYNPAGPYFTAAVDTFFRNPPKDEEGREALDVQDRQRCIVALQASTGLAAPLAIHVYVSLMEKIRIHEIAHIILLAGLYTGVPNFFTGFETLSATLKILNQLALKAKDPKQPDPTQVKTKQVATALQTAFASARSMNVSTALGIELEPEESTGRRFRAF